MTYCLLSGKEGIATIRREPMRTEQGRLAEDAACRYLRGRGLTLVTRNYRCRQGEIDLVMKDRDCLVFVEVRYRANPRFGSGAETIDRRKQARLITAARHYLQRCVDTADVPCRFDVVALAPGTAAGSLQWIRDAFQT